ncbi:MAG: LacI family DNA-binding transcriptional regulator [Actinomycetales bacterium]|jgi:LacI family transcriptional regulator
MTRPVRLSDVAAAAKTSTKTASRVINGDPRVSADTRARVQRAVVELGYRVDLLARSLRRGVDDAVGVLVPSIGDPFFASALHEIEQLGRARGIQVIIASTPRDPVLERRAVETLLARRVAGLIITPFFTDYRFLAQAATPVVFFDRAPVGVAAETVLVDDKAGAQLVVRHLASFGHRRIALIGDSVEVPTSNARRAGYLQALHELGLAVDPLLDRSDCVDAARAYQQTKALLELPNPPTAIFSGRAETSLGVARALHRHNRTDIAMASFDDFALAEILEPAISVTDHDPRALARFAMERLLARLDGAPFAPGEHLLPLQVIARGSGELRPLKVLPGAASLGVGA